MKLLTLLTAVLLLAACGESEPERDPILDKVNELSQIDAMEINERANAIWDFRKLAEIKEKYKDEPDIHDLDDQMAVVRGTIKHVTSESMPIFSIALHTDGSTIAYQMKEGQEYYRDQLKEGQKIKIVGQFDLGSRSNDLYYPKMYDGVLVR